MKTAPWLKVAVAALIGAVLWILFKTGAFQYLDLEYIRANLSDIQSTSNAKPIQSGFLFVAIYFLVTALSLPGATVLTLLGGAIFGLIFGTVLVSLASTMGATGAFLLSRWLVGTSLRSKYAERFRTIDEGFRRDGWLYLLSLRLIPLFPFFLVNLAMGLTNIRTLTYTAVSMLGMLPGTLVYVNAGTELASIESPRELSSPGLIFSLTLLGLLPAIGKGLQVLIQNYRLYSRFPKPKKYDYNLIVIGAGSAGLVTAYIAAAVRAKVALIESGKMGGDCLNTGCVPSKALIRTARFIQSQKRARDYGAKSAAIDFDFAEVMERVQSVIRKIEPHDSTERYTDLGVECIQGRAQIRTPFEIEVDGRRLTAKNIVIATGARPVVPEIPGLKDLPYLTSENLWSLRNRPDHLLVLGGGPIGCELAQAFAHLGIKVTLVERGSSVLPREDKDVSELLKNQFTQEGIGLRLNRTVTEFTLSGGRPSALLDDGESIEFSHVLLALGRKANVENLGLEALGLCTTAHGTLEVDAHLRTRFPNILACGDVVGPYQFTHMAAHQAWFASVNSLFGFIRKFKVDYRVVPWATYTFPEVARVGMNENEVKKKNIPHQISRYDLEDLDRAITDSADRGFVKVITKANSDQILGVTIVADHASEMLPEYITAMKYGLGLNKILGTIHVYPTMSEANKYVAGVWKKRNAPESALRWLERLHRWRRS